jgi:hypothetical protein
MVVYAAIFDEITLIQSRAIITWINGHIVGKGVREINEVEHGMFYHQGTKAPNSIFVLTY